MYDAVVVGAGLGGLVAGAKLAKAGKRVCVLEQQARPGGCATNYRRKKYEVDVSLHILDGFDSHDPKRPILEELGVFSELEWLEVPGPFYRVTRGDDELSVPFGLEAATDALSARFPEDRGRIGRLLRAMRRVRNEISSFPHSPKAVMRRIPFFPLLYPNFLFTLGGSLGQILDRRLRSEELKLSLIANLPFIHDDPYTVSGKFFSVAQAAFLEAGAVYVKGGSQQLSNQLARSIEASGGEVRLRHRVTRLITQGDRVTAVEVQPRRQAPERIEAREVLVNAAVPYVLDKLLDDGADPKLDRTVRSFRVGPSLLAFHAGLARPLDELGSRNYLGFDIPPHVQSLRDFGPNAAGAYRERIMSITDYGQVDAGLAPQGKGLVATCMLDRMEAWDGLDESGYAERKAELEDMFLTRLEGFYPGMRKEVEFTELATPRTVRRYTNATEGSFAGFEQSPGQALLKRFFKVRSGLRNLTFTGAWQFPGGGYTCAMLGGYLAAMMVLEGRLQERRPLGYRATASDRRPASLGAP